MTRGNEGIDWSREASIVQESAIKAAAELRAAARGARAIVYSHDTYGLGNIRRMLAISRHLVEHLPDLSILLITGSPVIHSFRLPSRLDYIKLPCLSRVKRESYSSKYLKLGDVEMTRLRSILIQDAVLAFEPDLFLVDKKPYGINNELTCVIRRLRRERPWTNHVLILRDIIDSPEATIRTWEERDYYRAIDLFDQILVLGSRDVFDLCSEYRLPAHAAEKVTFCGYTRREGTVRERAEVRREIGVEDDEKLVLVTTGGGQDGAFLLKAYLDDEPLLGEKHGVKSLIVDGPEIPELHWKEIHSKASGHPRVTLLDFTDDMLSLMNAADLVVSMGGYNTTCEILTLNKRAIVVPRVAPVEEQLIRAERLSRMGCFRVIHPSQLQAGCLAQAVLSELNEHDQARSSTRLDLNGLPRIAEYVRGVLNTVNAERGMPIAAHESVTAPENDFIHIARPVRRAGSGVAEGA